MGSRTPTTCCWSLLGFFPMCKFWLSQPLYAHFGPQFLLYFVPHAPHPLQMVLGQQHQIGLPSLVSPQPHRFILLQKLSCPWIPTNTNEIQRIPKTVDCLKLRHTNITKRPAQPEPGYSHAGRISTAAPQCVSKSQSELELREFRPQWDDQYVYDSDWFSMLFKTCSVCYLSTCWWPICVVMCSANCAPLRIGSNCHLIWQGKSKSLPRIVPGTLFFAWLMKDSGAQWHRNCTVLNRQTSSGHAWHERVRSVPNRRNWSIMWIICASSRPSNQSISS